MFAEVSAPPWPALCFAAGRAKRDLPLPACEFSARPAQKGLSFRICFHRGLGAIVRDSGIVCGRAHRDPLLECGRSVTDKSRHPYKRAESRAALRAAIAVHHESAYPQYRNTLNRRLLLVAFSLVDR